MAALRHKHGIALLGGKLRSISAWGVGDGPRDEGDALAPHAQAHEYLLPRLAVGLGLRDMHGRPLPPNIGWRSLSGAAGQLRGDICATFVP
jgi:hypothetical protein